MSSTQQITGSSFKTEKLSFHFELLEVFSRFVSLSRNDRGLGRSARWTPGFVSVAQWFFRLTRSEPSKQRLRKALLACLLLSSSVNGRVGAGRQLIL